MKTFSRIVIVNLLMFASYISNAQGINFQGVARSANGTILASSSISLRLSILSKSVDATPEYIEVKKVVTNAQGIFSIVVGDAVGGSTTGSFKNLDWANAPKFLKVEMDPSGGTSYINMGITRLQYVPFSFYSLGVAAENVNGILPVEKGGTGVGSLADLKTALKLSNFDSTALSNRIDYNLIQIASLKNKTSYLLDSIGNIGIGVNALSKTQFRKDNSGIGLIAPGANILPQNIAIGDSALLQNTSGAFNIAIGTKSLSKITNSGDNTALGFASLLNLSSQNGGWANTALGTTTLMNNQDGNVNVAIGSGSMQLGTTGSFNTATGAESLIQNNGNFNTAFGIYSLHENTTGNNNTAIGDSAGYNITTGSQNTFVGNKANTSVGNIANATALGNGAIVNSSNSIQLGNTSVTDVKTSGVVTASGFKTPNGTSAQYLRADGTVTTSVTAGVPYTGASQAVDLGAYDLKVNGLTVGIGAGANPFNTAVGKIALRNNTTGQLNTAIGLQALNNNTTGSNNTANGVLTLNSNTIGNANTAIGYAALNGNTTGDVNTAVGVGALQSNTSGSGNSANGRIALSSNTTGDYNTSSGSEGLYYNTTGSYNSAFGNLSLLNNITGSYNTAIGNNANVASGNLSNATAIGNGAIVNSSNSIQLGNTAVTDVKTSGAITAAGFKTPNGTSTQYLMADGTVSSGSGGSGLTLLGKIIYVKHATVSLAAEIWSANYDGTNQTKINITLPSGIILGTEYGINLSPNGQKIFFCAGPPYSGDPVKTIEASIYSCNIDGSNVVKIIDRGTRNIMLTGAY